MNDPSLHRVFYKSGVSNYFELGGVNNVSLSKATSFSDQYLLGGNYSSTQINSPEQVELSFDRSFIKKDDLLQYTGENPISEAYVYNGKNFYFAKDLYLNSYSVGFSVGELPRISTKFISYGSELAESPSIPSSSIVSTFTYDIPKLGSIFLSGPDSSKLANLHNIFSFDYSIEINRQPLFSVGTKIAQVCPILPLKINFTINSKLAMEGSDLSDSFSKSRQQNYNFDITVLGTYGSANFPIRNSQLVSSEITLSNNNTIEMKRQFLGYYGL
jgi:hypothetical protein